MGIRATENHRIAHSNNIIRFFREEVPFSGKNGKVD